MSILQDNGFLILLLFHFLPLNGQHLSCGNEYMFNDVISKTKAVEADREIANFLLTNGASMRSELLIKVVVHIVWNQTNENLSDKLVLSQIEAINRDFNAENIDIQSVPEEFRSAIGNTGIRFCLASIDPFGEASTGIVRIKTHKTEIGLTTDLYSSANGGSDVWDPEKYLNIWIANTGYLISGLGTYPNQTSLEKTGVVVHPKYFGINAHPKYGLGKVATHEIGHFLGLKHLWGDDTNCETDDEVLDTPLQKNAYSGCPYYPQAGCSESEMFMNFMDYTYDPCMLIFTKGQADRMLATINTFRIGLVSTKSSCLTPLDYATNQLTIYPNPSNGFFLCKYAKAPMGIVKYNLYNVIGQSIYGEEKIINSDFTIDLSSFAAGLYF